MSANPDLVYEITGPLASVQLNRPAAFNTLTLDMVRQLLAIFRNLRRRADVRVVVLSGAGGQFCAGLDLKQPLPALVGGPAEGMLFMQDFGDLVLHMRACPQPIVCQLDGAAVGGGLALAAASDIRIGTPRLRLNAAFVQLGLSGVEMGLSWLLPRLVGASVASELLLTGRFIDGAEARAIGLLSRLVDPAALGEATTATVEALLAADPLGLRLTKEALNAALGGGGLEAAIALENRNQSLCFASGAVQAQVEAFRRKRAEASSAAAPT